MTPRALRIKNPKKGFETQGRRIAQKLDPGVRLFEYWQFLNAYCDLSSDEGLTLLENHLVDMTRRINAGMKQKELEELDNDLQDMSLGNQAGDGSNHLSNVPSSSTSDPLSPMSQLSEHLGKLQLTSPLPPPTSNSNISSGQEEQDVNGNNHGEGSDNLENNAEDGATVPYERFESVPSQVGSDDQEENSDNNKLGQSGDPDSDDEDQSSFLTAEEGVWIFLTGSEPCCTDQQVFDLLRDLPGLDAEKYPKVLEWRDLVGNCFSEQERLDWGSQKATASRGGRNSRRNFIAVPKLSFHDFLTD